MHTIDMYVQYLTVFSSSLPTHTSISFEGNCDTMQMKY